MSLSSWGGRRGIAGNVGRDEEGGLKRERDGGNEDCLGPGRD